jgi:SAM-dependent methyltransferase
VAKAILAPFNLTITRIDPDPGCALEWIAESQAKGMAVNDFIERDHRKPALSELEQLVFPRVSTHSTVCELGPGTGVYTRYINDYITDGEFHVVDSDPNAIAFLREHLPANPRTHLHLSSGTGLPFGPEVKFDLAFGASIFTGGNLSYFFRYAQEFSRALRPHGYLVFDYFDISTDAGWEVLTKNMARKQPIFAYTYHSTEAVNKVLDMLGFRIVDRQLSVRGSVFVTAQKL